MLDEWRHDDLATEIITQQSAAARTRKENDQKTIWWQHVHLDALWPMTQGTTGIFGVLGLHTTIDLTGRIELFIAPGAILLRVPSPSGNGQWKPATDWGFSYRLADFTMPRTRRPATLHVNLARVWFIGGSDSVPGVRNDLYLAWILADIQEGSDAVDCAVVLLTHCSRGPTPARSRSAASRLARAAGAFPFPFSLVLFRGRPVHASSPLRHTSSLIHRRRSTSLSDAATAVAAAAPRLDAVATVHE